MVKKFTANCNINGSSQPFTLYIGVPYPDSHPLMFQSRWLASERGGMVPKDVMDSFEKLQKIANEGKISFEDLCAYVIEQINSEDSLKKDVELASKIQDSEKIKTKSEDGAKPKSKAQNVNIDKDDDKDE
jgi:hypothetical protein